jgi:uncharacterized protein (DUF2236 family)
LAHPWVARAISEHSRVISHPLDRFHQTFNVMFTMVFGSLEQALSAARRLHRRHARIEGVVSAAVGPFAQCSPYWANEVSALCWVHATLLDTALATYMIVFPVLTAHERERLYDESKVLARLFGIPEDRLPQTWDAFTDYMASMYASDILTVGADTRLLADRILAGAAVGLRAPGWYRAITARLLSQRLREAFGLEYSSAEQRLADKAIAWIRLAYPALPDRLRCVGPYQEAEARLSGVRRPNLFTRVANRLAIGQPWMDGGSFHCARLQQELEAQCGPIALITQTH